MRNKKGFTLVELVIVIAVIAILAGVMIGTFASVVKKAKESAKMQEMANQKQQQMIDDIDAKLKDDAWLGWEDFETKLAEAVSKALSGNAVGTDNTKEVKAAVEEAVSAAFAKYAASLGTDKTGLTEEQVKYIVESALAKNSYTGVTEAQVKAIVNNATSGLSNLNKSQVNAIVSQIVNAASEESKLTLSQITIAIKALDEKVTSNANKLLSDDDIKDAVDKAMKEYGASTLDADDITALLAKYVSNGTVKGDYSWYKANSAKMEIKAAEQLVALSTMAKGGTSFAGKTITIADSVDLTTTTDFQPIVDFDGKLVGTKGKTVTVDVEPVWNTAEGRNGKTMMNYFVTGQNWQKDAVAYGFVASLVDGGVIEDLEVVLEVNAKDPGNKYTYFGGIVGFLDGGIIRNCKVTGKIDAFGRIGGVVGYAKSGTISGVDVSELKITSHTSSTNDNINTYANIGGIAGYVSAGKLEVTGCTVVTSVDGKYTVDKKNHESDANVGSAKAGIYFGVVDRYKENEWVGVGETTKVTVKDNQGVIVTMPGTNNIGWYEPATGAIEFNK